MIEIYRYDIKEGTEKIWEDDGFYTKDGDVEFFERYINSLNKAGGKRFYYWKVPIYVSKL